MASHAVLLCARRILSMMGVHLIYNNRRVLSPFITRPLVVKAIICVLLETI